MKNVMMMIVAVVLLTACDNNKAQKEKAAANVALIGDFLDAIEKKDYESMGEMLAENYMGYGPSVYDSINKEQRIEAWKFNSVNVYESIDFKALQLLPAFVDEGPSAGEWISGWANLELWFKNADIPVNIWVNTVYKIEGGKIARSRTFMNEADVMKQMGLPTFPPLFLPEGTDIDVDSDEGEDDDDTDA